MITDPEDEAIGLATDKRGRDARAERPPEEGLLLLYPISRFSGRDQGTRVPVRTLLASLAEGAMVDEVVADFPTVSRDGMRAVLAFAAASAGDDLPVPAAPAAVVA